MSERAHRRMTADEFLQWDLAQPDARHELVDGVPMAMTGANRRHDRVVVNTMVALGTRLRGGGCVPFSADIAVKIPNGNVRRPDVGVDCAPLEDTTTIAGDLRVVVEVLSPSTRAFDRFRKVEEYKSVPSLAHILLLDPDAPGAMLWSRDAAGAWTLAIVEGREAQLDLTALGVALRLADLYDGLTFPPAPRLVLEQPT